MLRATRSLVEFKSFIQNVVGTWPELSERQPMKWAPPFSHSPSFPMQAALAAVHGHVSASSQTLTPSGGPALCPTGLERVPCSGILDVQFINMDKSVERAANMSEVLRVARAHDTAGLVRTISRFPAVQAECTKDRPDLACEMSNRSALTSLEVALIEDPLIKERAHKERAGLLGCWSSHLAAIRAFAQAPDAARWLLLLEDDAASNAVVGLKPGAQGALRGTPAWVLPVDRAR